MGSMGKGVWNEEKRTFIVVLRRRNQATDLFTGHVFRNRHLSLSEDGVFSSPMSKGHQVDTQACPVGGSGILTSLPQLS